MYLILFVLGSAIPVFASRRLENHNLLNAFNIASSQGNVGIIKYIDTEVARTEMKEFIEYFSGENCGLLGNIMVVPCVKYSIPNVNYSVNLLEDNRLIISEAFSNYEDANKYKEKVDSIIGDALKSNSWIRTSEGSNSSLQKYFSYFLNIESSLLSLDTEASFENEAKLMKKSCFYVVNPKVLQSNNNKFEHDQYLVRAKKIENYVLLVDFRIKKEAKDLLFPKANMLETFSNSNFYVDLATNDEDIEINFEVSYYKYNLNETIYENLTLLFSDDYFSKSDDDEASKSKVAGIPGATLQEEIYVAIGTKVSLQIALQKVCLPNNEKL